MRFGETIKAYTAREGSAAKLVAIPLGIAGFLRYMMGIDDKGNTYELAPDPLAGMLHEQLSSIEWGKPESLTNQLRPILSNKNIFFTDLYEAGLGEKIEEMLRGMLRDESIGTVLFDSLHPMSQKEPSPLSQYLENLKRR